MSPSIPDPYPFAAVLLFLPSLSALLFDGTGAVLVLDY